MVFALYIKKTDQNFWQKFWSGLENEMIKNALRHRYENLDFEQLVAETRAIEEEKEVHTKKVKSNQITSENSKLDTILKKMELMEADIKKLKEERSSETSGGSKKGPVICTTCKLEGHFFWGCKSGQDVTCHRCGAKGHLAHSCRNKKKALNTN